MLTCQNGYVGRAGRKGRGVFARKRLTSGELVESSPFIVIPPRDDSRLSDTIVESYWFEVKGKWSAIGLGFTSLYNHSEEPNATFLVSKKRRTITIKAIKSIKRDEEITINYGYKLEA